MSEPLAREEMQKTVDAAVQPLVTELRWQRWLLFVLLAATLSPKVGGPAPPSVVAHVIHSLESAAQAAG